MREAKKRAVVTGRTLTELVERAVRDLIAREEALEEGEFQLEWIVVEGGAQPGVDFNDRDALYELMERDG